MQIEISCVEIHKLGDQNTKANLLVRILFITIYAAYWGHKTSVFAKDKGNPICACGLVLACF